MAMIIGARLCALRLTTMLCFDRLQFGCPGSALTSVFRSISFDVFIHYIEWSQISVIFSVYCLFAAIFLVLHVTSFCSIAVAIHHRGPIATLMVSLFLAFLYCVAQIVGIFLSDTSILPEYQAVIVLDTIAGLFNWWCNIILFTAIFLLFRDRESALESVTEPRGKFAYTIQTAIHATLLAVMFSLSTAAFALNAALQADGLVTHLDYENRYSQIQNIAYAADAFFVLTSIDVCVTTHLLHRRVRRVGANNQITKMLLYVVSPLVALNAVNTFVFTIVLSRSGVINSDGSVQSILRAALMNDIFRNLFFAAIFITLMMLPFKRSSWDIQGVVSVSESQSWNISEPPVASGYHNNFASQSLYTHNQPTVMTQVAQPHSI
ncbi:hypothetical protein BD410DRAFT_786478 [Rickenella mellea]|uniref:Uncharacterized protein n=1 Tax=Rickenella mellea TaxID=50990 RepID=A0A4Y7QAR0_9AGAM|nr:hypothetical protein BD410DRAFT_786478 [Rickenella mellea]